MLARVVFAVACSIAALKYAQFKANRIKRHGSQETLERDGRCPYTDKETCTHATKYCTPQEKGIKIKHASLGSPSSSNRSLHGKDELLLPEFDVLCQEVIDISSDSDSSAATGGNSHESEKRTKCNSAQSIDSKKYLSSSDDDDDALQAFKALNTFSDHDNTLSNSPGEILELKSIIEDFRHREVKLESELLRMKDKENKFVELERRLLGRNAELMAIIEGFKEREAQHQVELLQYYGLKEQEKICRDLESQLLRKDGELKKLTGLLGSLQEQNNKIVRDLQGKECVIKELGVATDKIRDLQSNQECLKGELEIAQDKIKDLQMTLQTQANQSKEQLLFLRQQVSELEEREHNASEKCLEMGRKLKKLKECEAIAARLTKKCNFLEQEKHELTVQLDTVEAKLSKLSIVMESDVMVKVQAQTSTLRQENENLRKQVEGLQMTKSGEVDELVRLRWFNICLRNEVQHYKVIIHKAMDLTLAKNLSPDSKQKAIQLILEYGDLEKVSLKSIDQIEQEFDSISSLPSTPSEHDRDDFSMDCNLDKNPRSKKSSFIKRLTKWSKSKGGSRSSLPSELRSSDSGMLSPIHDSLKLKDSLWSLLMRDTSDDRPVAIRQSDVQSGGNWASDCNKIHEELAPIRTRSKAGSGEHLGMVVPSSNIIPKMVVNSEKEKSMPLKQRHGVSLAQGRTLSEVDHSRIRKHQTLQPVTVQCRKLDENSSNLANLQNRDLKPPKPVPDSVKFHMGPDLASQQMRLAPTANRQKIAEEPQTLVRTKGRKYTVVEPPPDNTRGNGNLSVSGPFIEYLAKEVRSAAYEEIDDVVEFVSWLDEELSFLVDDQAALTSFDWPETKLNSLREAAYGYMHLSELEAEIGSFKDDSSVACEASLNNMLSMLEKVEQILYPVLSIRDMVIARYDALSIASRWMLDSGLIGKIKLATVQLARQFMKRVISEIDSLAGACDLKVPQRELLLFQGVRFALRVYQLAGGFDHESIQVFEDLRLRASAPTPNQPQ